MDDETYSNSTSSSTRIPKIFDRFYDSSSSSEPEEHDDLAGTHTKRLDYMIQFLDRRLQQDNNNFLNQHNLPEFIASGGNQGIFKLPIRGAVRYDRPPCLELRPHPLTETQIGCFLRNLVCVDDKELWAGSESGVRVWKLGDVYKAAEEEGVVVEGDEESAPFRESGTVAPTLCLVGCEGSRMVWSGHRDGRIRCWKMLSDCCNDGDSVCDGSAFKEVLCWQAHRAPVLSMVVTLYGNVFV